MSTSGLTVRSALLCCALFGWVSAAEATAIPIANAGFENPVVGLLGPLTDWTLSGTSGSGVWNINAFPLGFWTVGAPEGNQIAYVAGAPRTTGASISQILGDTLLDGQTYTLTGFVGQPIGFGSTPPPTTYTIALFADGVLLNSISGTGPEGTFVPFSLTFDSTGSALVGQPIEIRLSSDQAQTGFDDLRLNYAGGEASVPEPATLTLLALGLSGLGVRFRRASKR